MFFFMLPVIFKLLFPNEGEKTLWKEQKNSHQKNFWRVFDTKYHKEKSAIHGSSNRYLLVDMCVSVTA